MAPASSTPIKNALPRVVPQPKAKVQYLTPGTVFIPKYTENPVEGQEFEPETKENIVFVIGETLFKKELARQNGDAGKTKEALQKFWKHENGIFTQRKKNAVKYFPQDFPKSHLVYVGARVEEMIVRRGSYNHQEAIVNFARKALQLATEYDKQNRKD